MCCSLAIAVLLRPQRLAPRVPADQHQRPVRRHVSTSYSWFDRPTPEVVAAVQAAVAWFDRVKIAGIRIDDVETPAGHDRVVVADPEAPPLWARFYEIGTDRPIFSSRCEVPDCTANPWFMVRPTLAEIERERRSGYQWYSKAPATVLRDYPAWRERWAPAAEHH